MQSYSYCCSSSKFYKVWRLVLYILLIILFTEMAIKTITSNLKMAIFRSSRGIN